MSIELERGVRLPCGTEHLFGVVHDVARPSEVAVVMVVGGPQYRGGSHRLFVLLARAIARSGIPVLRFDVRGMGDSTGAPRSFESLSDDIGAAIDAMQADGPAWRRVVLLGLCDGASAAMLYADERRDRRIAGICALNPWVHQDATPEHARVRLRHYYLRRVVSPEFWRKLGRGAIGWRALAELFDHAGTAWGRRPAPRHAAAAPFPERMARGLLALRGVPLLIVLSGNDYTAREFELHARRAPSWQQLLAEPRLRCEAVAEADHSFSGTAAQARLEALVHRWLRHGVCAPVRHTKTEVA